MLSRRTLFKLSAGVSLAALGALPGSAAVHEIPVFDAHVHYSDDQHAELSTAEAIRLLDRAGVRMALVSSTPDEGTVRLLRAAPGRFVAELRPYRNIQDVSTWHSDTSILGYLEERLRLGLHSGIGEFHVFGEEAASPVVRDVVRMAVERDLVLHAHSDARAVTLLFAHDARARVLWAHLGFTGWAHLGYPGAAEVEAMLQRFPRLWMETSSRTDMISGGQLQPQWRDLFERYPERILIGTDTHAVSRWRSMPRILEETRAWLRTLPEDVAENLAWRNAAYLYDLDAAAFTRYARAPARRRSPSANGRTSL
jgi:hypothetical protein